MDTSKLAPSVLIDTKDIKKESKDLFKDQIENVSPIHIKQYQLLSVSEIKIKNNHIEYKIDHIKEHSMARANL